jgi:hypothetical protein
MTNLYIPKKIKIGFQNRSDTFTGKLAFITYEDSKGVLRQQKAWDGWRDHKIDVIEFDNTAQNGFIFNKGVQRHGYWGSGRSVIRVYDSRDFEFEINIDNLIGILMHSDINKRDIVEPCVFAWANKSLVLLPVNSEEYQQSLIFTQKQHQNIATSDLKEGYRYNQKKNENVLIYMGYRDWWDISSSYNEIKHAKKGKKHIFFDGNNYKPINVETLSTVNSEDIVEHYATLVDDFFKTIHSQPSKEISVNHEESEDSDYYQYRIDNDKLVLLTKRYNDDFNIRLYKIKKNSSLSFQRLEDVNFVQELTNKWKKYLQENGLVVKDYNYSEYYAKAKDLLQIFLQKEGFGSLDLHLKNDYKVLYNLY